jgi:hypothetical protein
MPSEKTEQDMGALREHLERFSELGEKHVFQFRDGRPFEGWVLEVGEADLLVVVSAPIASDEEVTVPFSEIDLATLAYIDESGARIPYAPVPPPRAPLPS